MLIDDDVISLYNSRMDRSALLGLCVAGSHAYGLDHATSDRDFKGIFISEIHALAGLRPPKLSLHIESGDIDIALHEVGSFFKMCLNANPNILECLFGFGPDNQKIYGAGMKGMDVIYQNREQFLGAENIATSYIGFAQGQVKRFKSHPDNPKLARHGVRMMISGLSLLETGTLTLKLTDEQKEFVTHCEDTFDHDALECFVAEQAKIIEKAKQATSLPERASWDFAEDLLKEVRRMSRRY